MAGILLFSQKQIGIFADSHRTGFRSVRANCLNAAIPVFDFQLVQNCRFAAVLRNFLPGLRAEIPSVRHKERQCITPLPQQRLHRINLIIQNFIVNGVFRRKFPVVRAFFVQENTVDAVRGGVQPCLADLAVHKKLLCKADRRSYRPKGRHGNCGTIHDTFNPPRPPACAVQQSGFKKALCAAGIPETVPYRDLPEIPCPFCQTFSFIGNKALLIG